MATWTFAAVVCVTACGRTAPSDHGTIACDDDPVGTCAELQAQRDTYAQSYDRALHSQAPDDTLADLGACTARVAARQRELGCLTDPCADLCTLHPCPAAFACPDACRAAATRFDVDTDALTLAVVRAAAQPYACTCDVCDGESDALCDAVWNCNDLVDAP